MSEPDHDQVMRERPHLIGLAYRLLGSLADAEDAVQETFARWYAMTGPERDAIASPGAWLTTVAGRVCLDLLGSARARRERYVGAWIPEPLPGGVARIGDPADRVALDESLTMAFLVVLESMTPAERVAFVLHDVFRYPFAEIAEIVGRTPAACRQLATSARRRVRPLRTGAATPAQHARVVREFKRAWAAGDIDALVSLLDPAAVAVADGGGVVPTVPRPVVGGEQIARYAVEMAGWAPRLRLRERTVNGLPGLVAERDGVTVAVLAFDVARGRIRRVWGVRNPDKLRPWLAAPADRKPVAGAATMDG